MADKLGKKLWEKTVPANNTTSGLILKGQTLRIIDVEGQQVADFVSWRHLNPFNPKSVDISEYIDVVYTNCANRRYKVGTGDKIYSNRLNPMWSITHDDCEDHYMGGGSCSADLNRFDGEPGKRGCRDRLELEIDKYGLLPTNLHSVSTFDIFMNVGYDPDGTWEIRRPITKAGDYIDIRAEMDMLWAASVCDSASPTNGDIPTPLKFELYDKP